MQTLITLAVSASLASNLASLYMVPEIFPPEKTITQVGFHSGLSEAVASAVNSANSSGSVGRGNGNGNGNVGNFNGNNNTGSNNGNNNTGSNNGNNNATDGNGNNNSTDGNGNGGGDQQNTAPNTGTPRNEAGNRGTTRPKDRTEQTQQQRKTLDSAGNSVATRNKNRATTRCRRVSFLGINLGQRCD